MLFPVDPILWNEYPQHLLALVTLFIRRYLARWQDSVFSVCLSVVTPCHTRCWVQQSAKVDMTLSPTLPHASVRYSNWLYVIDIN